MSDFKIDKIVPSKDGFWVHLINDEPAANLFPFFMIMNAVLIFFCTQIFGPEDFRMDIFVLILCSAGLSIISMFIPIIMFLLTVIMGVVYWIM
jgi:hypothetical protein